MEMEFNNKIQSIKPMVLRAIKTLKASKIYNNNKKVHMFNS